MKRKTYFGRNISHGIDRIGNRYQNNDSATEKKMKLAKDFGWTNLKPDNTTYDETTIKRWVGTFIIDSLIIGLTLGSWIGTLA